MIDHSYEINETGRATLGAWLRQHVADPAFALAFGMDEIIERLLDTLTKTGVPTLTLSEREAQSGVEATMVLPHSCIDRRPLDATDWLKANKLEIMQGAPSTAINKFGLYEWICFPRFTTKDRGEISVRKDIRVLHSEINDDWRAYTLTDAMRRSPLVRQRFEKSLSGFRKAHSRRRAAIMAEIEHRVRENGVAYSASEITRCLRFDASADTADAACTAREMVHDALPPRAQSIPVKGLIGSRRRLAVTG